MKILFVPSGNELFCLTQIVNSEERFALLTVKKGFAEQTQFWRSRLQCLIDVISRLVKHFRGFLYLHRCGTLITNSSQQSSFSQCLYLRVIQFYFFPVCILYNMFSPGFDEFFFYLQSIQMTEFCCMSLLLY